jgi:hypothetical protein
MNANRAVSVSMAAQVAIAGVLVAAATGVAFAGWMEHGPGIFMATIEAGIAWCF